MIPPGVQAQIDAGFAAAELTIWRQELLAVLICRAILGGCQPRRQIPYFCGACIAGRPEECSGWCANYLTGKTE